MSSPLAISPSTCLRPLHHLPENHMTRRKLRIAATHCSMSISSPTRGITATSMARAAAGDVPPACSSESLTASVSLETGPLVPAAEGDSNNTESRGLEATLNGLSKWLLTAIFGVIIVWKHDAEVLWLTMGSVLNACLSITLKKIINHQRPVPNLKSGPGMPSSHAQSIFYASVILVLFMFHSLQVNIVTITIGAFALASSVYFTWLRVSQQYHTTSQVLVGAIIGSIFAMAWWWSWHSFVLDAFIRYSWVRAIFGLCAASLCAGFVIYIIRHWLGNGR